MSMIYDDAFVSNDDLYSEITNEGVDALDNECKRSINKSKIKDVETSEEEVKINIEEEEVKINIEEEEVKINIEEEEEEMSLRRDEKKARTFIENCRDYLTSTEFDSKCSELSILYKVSPTKVATKFSQKVLGAIGDVLGVAITTTYNSLRFLITLLNKILSSACGIICSVAYRLTTFFTLGYTCKI